MGKIFESFFTSEKRSLCESGIEGREYFKSLAFRNGMSKELML